MLDLRSRGWLLLGMVVPALCACAPGTTATSADPDQPAEPGPHYAFEVLADRPLPTELRWSSDVRFAADDAVLLAAGSDGVFRLSLSEETAPPSRVGADGHFLNGFALASNAGLVAAAVPFGPVNRIARDPPRDFREDLPMGGIVDFDLVGDLAVFLGARRDDEGTWAPEGALLWAGSPSRGFTDLEPRMFNERGADDRTFARCWFLMTGAVRALADDRYAVVPSTQPGAFVYDAEGKLLRAWQTTSLGFYDRCDLDDAESYRLGADIEARASWMARREVLDEILPAGGWPLLVIRTPEPDGAGWRLVALREDGVHDVGRLPVAGHSELSRLKGDVRGDLWVLLVHVEGRSNHPPAEPPRLVLLRRTDGATPTGTLPEVSLR